MSVMQSEISGASRSVGCTSDWYLGGRVFDPTVRQHYFVETDNALFLRPFK